MKILVIMKRFGANKDMVMENFGRQIRIFEHLAKKHKIDFFCLDYKKKESKELIKNNIRYIIKPISVFSYPKLLNSLKGIIKREKYDVVVATTDPLIGIISYQFTNKFNIPLVYDLQDNFESYDTYKIPFVRKLDMGVLKEAEIVLVASTSLKNHILKIRKKPIYVIHNGIELGLFKSIGKNYARKKLNLPLNLKIIVFIGHLEKLKGTDLLLNAFNIVREKHPDSYLLLSGKIEDETIIKQKNIIFRELPKREDVVLGINAADVAVIPNPINNFTKYCFPYKLVEYMACKVPIVATNIGDTSLVLKKYKGSLCRPNDEKDLAEKLIAKLQKPLKVNYNQEVTKLKWEVLAAKLDKILETLK